MRKIKFGKDSILEITTKDKICFKGDYNGETWENYYSVSEVHANRIVICKNGNKINDTLWVANSYAYDFDIFILDKEIEPEHFLWF